MLMLLNHRPPPSSANYSNDVAWFYGDSITQGYLLPNATNRFSTLLCTRLSMIEDNLGIGGSQIADPGEADLITTNLAIVGNSISVWLAGYNDMRYYGTDTNALNDNTAALESLAAWLALPSAMRQPWYVGINFSGNWGNTAVLGGLAYTTSPGDTATFNFSGTTLLVGIARFQTGGNAMVVVDGTVTNTCSCLRVSAPTGHNRNYSPGLLIVTNLANTAHTATFTATSSANTYLGWFAGYSTNQTPKVVLCGSLAIPPEGVGVGYPYVYGSDAAASAYSLAISNAAAALTAVKLNVRWVPAPVLDTNIDWEFDFVHPNESGHQKIENAIQTAF